MSLKIVTAEIERFLNAPEPEVLVIRGEWGTGKTYTWKKNISRLSTSDLPTSRYSYVSLFGVNSLNEFKFLERLPVVKDFASGIRSLAFLSLRNTLICIDDVESKGKDLDVREILGVVSQLKGVHLGSHQGKPLKTNGMTPWNGLISGRKAHFRYENGGYRVPAVTL